jgi:type IV pilus assembly protein PilA
MKKGFSLVELLAVIVILGLIVLISIPIVNSSINKTKEEAREVQIEEIIKAAKKYAIKNSYILPEVEGAYSHIEVQTLIDENYIDTDKIIDPVTETELTGCIRICYKCSEVEYEYEFKISCPV